MFINACFACTGQREFYSDSAGAQVGIVFLHHYIFGNYRRLYARTLAAGINHFNQLQIIARLLASGAPADAAERQEEGRLISAALHRLPPQRVLGLFRRLRRDRVNNRRTRAVIKQYLEGRPDRVFDAVKYRRKVAEAVSHVHLRLPPEFGRFLYGSMRGPSFRTELFEKCRQAAYSKAAVYELPYSIAEGFAAQHGIDRKTLLSMMQGRMTTGERLRVQRTAHKAGAVVELDHARAPLTQLCSHIVALPIEERTRRADELRSALHGAAARVARRGVRLGKVAAVLDCSYSSSGSSEKRRRPLALACGVDRLLAACCDEYKAFWTAPCSDPLLACARGQTDLASPLIAALRWKPELVIIVSDGCENSPPGGAAEVSRVYRERLDRDRRVTFVHLNPVFDGADLGPRALGGAIATVGIRGAEDLFTMLEFARFAEGAASLDDLQHYLGVRMAQLLGVDERRPS